MKSCISFFYKTILNKKSIYLFSLVLIFVYILITYILPYALKMNINQLLQMSIIMVLLILLIAIFGIIVSTTIFRQGIDDGSEILIITKCVTRKQIVLSKTIVLLSLIIFMSFLSFIIPIFLIFSKYGTSNPWDYAGGYFLVTIIVSILFSGISIFFCLVMKKTHATLAGLGIAFLLTLINSINFLLVNNPGYYIKKEGYSLQNVTYYDINNVPVNGVILNKHYAPYIIDKQQNIIQDIENKAIKSTNTKQYTFLDPFYQFSMLFSLGNFYYSKNNFSGKNIDDINSIFTTSTWNNIYFSFNSIKNFKLEKEFIITDNNISEKYTYIFNNDFQLINNSRNIKLFLNEYNLDLKKYFILPILNLDNDISKNLDLEIYDLENKESLLNLVNILFSSESNSIFTIYNKYLKILNLTNENNVINFYNYNSFLNTYLFLGYSLLFENIVNNNIINIRFNNLNININGNNLSFLINILKLDKNILLGYFQLNNTTELLNINYIQPTLIFLMLLRANVYNFQKYILINLENDYNFNLDNRNIVETNLLDFFQYNTNQFSDFVVIMNRNIGNKNYELINNFLSSHNPGYINNFLNSLNVGKINISANPYQILNSKTLNTFSKYNFEYFINIYGLIFGWLLISLSLLIISTLIYTKKDIK